MAARPYFAAFSLVFQPRLRCIPMHGGEGRTAFWPTALPQPMCRPAPCATAHAPPHFLALCCCRSLKLGQGASAGVGGAPVSESVPTPGQHHEGSSGAGKGECGNGTGKRGAATAFDLHSAALFAPPLAPHATAAAGTSRARGTDDGGTAGAGGGGSPGGSIAGGSGRPRRPSSMRALKLVSSLAGEGSAEEGEDIDARWVAAWIPADQPGCARTCPPATFFP